MGNIIRVQSCDSCKEIFKPGDMIEIQINNAHKVYLDEHNLLNVKISDKQIMTFCKNCSWNVE